MDSKYEIRLKTDEASKTERPVVVAVDGSAHNLAAIDWAATEAVRTGRPLMLVSADGEYLRPIPHFSADFDATNYEGHATTAVHRLMTELTEQNPGLEVTGYVTSDSAVGLVVEAADEAELVVVGKRGMRAFARVMIGSTSIAVAGRSPVPTVVVPDSWDQQAHAGKAVLVGVDTGCDDDHTLAFAFARARDLGVKLVALNGWETHPAVVSTDDDRRRWGREAEEMAEALIEPWRSKFPDVVVDVVQRHAHPAMALLEASADTQLIVLGRHTGGSHLGGFAFGSVARAVLHYSTTPVAVVPESTRS